MPLSALQAMEVTTARREEKSRIICRAAAFAEAGCRVESMIDRQRTKSGRAALIEASNKLKDEAVAIRKMADALIERNGPR